MGVNRTPEMTSNELQHIKKNRKRIDITPHEYYHHHSIHHLCAKFY